MRYCWVFGRVRLRGVLWIGAKEFGCWGVLVNWSFLIVGEPYESPSNVFVMGSELLVQGNSSLLRWTVGVIFLW